MPMQTFHPPMPARTLHKSTPKPRLHSLAPPRSPWLIDQISMISHPYPTTPRPETTQQGGNTQLAFQENKRTDLLLWCGSLHSFDEYWQGILWNLPLARIGWSLCCMEYTGQQEDCLSQFDALIHNVIQLIPSRWRCGPFLAGEAASSTGEKVKSGRGRVYGVRLLMN